MITNSIQEALSVLWMQRVLIQVGKFAKMDMLMEQGNVSLIVELGNMVELYSHQTESQLILAARTVILLVMSVQAVDQEVVSLAKRVSISKEIQRLRGRHLQKHLVLVLLKQWVPLLRLQSISNLIHFNLEDIIGVLLYLLQLELQLQTPFIC